MNESADNRVKGVQTAVRILESLDRLDDPNLQNVAEHLDLSTSAVHNHLVTLLDEQYVTKEGESYRPSFKFLEVGGRIRSTNDLYRYGRSKVDDLAASTGELANLMIEEHGSGTHIYLSKGEDAVAFDTHAGKRYPLHNNALGKSILANMPEDRRETILSETDLVSTTENTITDVDGLQEELRSIRESGIAYDDEERIGGLRCVAAPVIVDDVVLGSVSVSGPASRIKASRFREELPEQISRTADLISIDINYA